MLIYFLQIGAYLFNVFNISPVLVKKQTNLKCREEKLKSKHRETKPLESKCFENTFQFETP